MTTENDEHTACRAALAEAQATIDALELQLVAYDALDGANVSAGNEIHRALEHANLKASQRSSLVRAADQLLTSDQLTVLALSLRGHTASHIARTLLTTVGRVQQLLGAAERRLAQAVFSAERLPTIKVRLTRCEDCARVLEVNQPTLDRQLEEIFAGRLSVRVLNAFWHADRKIVTVNDLLLCRPSDLLKLKNFGRRSLWEVEACMASIGMHVGDGFHRDARRRESP